MRTRQPAHWREGAEGNYSITPYLSQATSPGKFQPVCWRGNLLKAWRLVTALPDAPANPEGLTLRKQLGKFSTPHDLISSLISQTVQASAMSFKLSPKSCKLYMIRCHNFN